MTMLKSALCVKTYSIACTQERAPFAALRYRSSQSRSPGRNRPLRHRFRR